MTKPKPSEAMAQIDAGPEIPTHSEILTHPSDSLLNLIVTLLAPMFLGAGGGNLTFARMAALETVNAYRVRNQADLIAVAQIVAFGLAALGSLSLSMADNLSLSMILRLRGNANALNRSAEQNRRALRQSQAASRAPRVIARPKAADEPDANSTPAPEAASVSQPSGKTCSPLEPEPTRSQPATEAPKPLAASIPAALQTPPPAPEIGSITDRQRQAMWAAAMTTVAKEYTASLPHLPPAERKAASFRATALSSCATQLLSGAPASDAIMALPRNLGKSAMTGQRHMRP